jgi:hypothetical protein
VRFLFCEIGKRDWLGLLWPRVFSRFTSESGGMSLASAVLCKFSACFETERPSGWDDASADFCAQNEGVHIMANTPSGQRSEPRMSGTTGSTGTQFASDTRRQQEAGRLGEKAKEEISSVGEKAKDLACAVGQTASDVASNIGHKAGEMASTVSEKAGNVASTIGQKAEDTTAAVGSGMKNLAGTLREKLPHEGMLGSASSAIASTLESSGRYLQEEGLRGMASDLTNLIRRNPIPALLVGIGIGFLIARSTRS